MGQYKYFPVKPHFRKHRFDKWYYDVMCESMNYESSWLEWLFLNVKERRSILQVKKTDYLWDSKKMIECVGKCLKIDLDKCMWN